MEVICYLSNGYPSVEEGRKKVDLYYDAGCRIIEIDLPSVDPYLEGDLIAGRMKSALGACSDYDVYLEMIADVKKTYEDLKVILLAYEDTMESIGIEKLVNFCLENHIKDVIVVGDKTPGFKEKLMDAGLLVSCYIRYHLPEDEIEAAKNSNGFIYLQAKPIGSPINPQFPELKHCVNELRRLGFTRSIYCGVGVYTIEDVAMVKNAGADAAFVGSSILKVDHDPVKLKEVIQSFVTASKSDVK